MCASVQADSGSESHFGFNGSKEFVLEFCLFSTHVRNKMDEVLTANQNAHNYAPNFEKVGDILVSACPCVCVRMGHRDIALKLHV